MSCLEQCAQGCVAEYEETPCNARPTASSTPCYPLGCYLAQLLDARRPARVVAYVISRHALRAAFARRHLVLAMPMINWIATSFAVKGCRWVEHRCFARNHVPSIHPSRCRRRPRAAVLWRGAQGCQSRTQLVLSSCRSICRAVDAVRPHRRDCSWGITPRCDGSSDRDESMAGRVDVG